MNLSILNILNDLILMVWISLTLFVVIATIRIIRHG